MGPHRHREAEFTTFASTTVEPVFIHVRMLAEALFRRAEIDGVPGVGDAEKMTGAAADRDAFDDEQRGILRPQAAQVARGVDDGARLDSRLPWSPPMATV